jgi:hypothetical protein
VAKLRLANKGWSSGRPLVALIAVFALSLRLAWPAPPIGLVIIGDASFGEHALCLAAGSEAPPPGNEAPAAPSEHDGGHCCLFHAASGLSSLPPAIVARVAFAEPVLALPADAPYRAPAYPPGTSPARAPPFAI